MKYILVTMQTIKEILNIAGPIIIVALAILYASWAIKEINNQRDDEDNNYPSSPSSASA